MNHPVKFQPRNWHEQLPLIRIENEEWRRDFQRRCLVVETRRKNRAKRSLGVAIRHTNSSALVPA